MINRFMRAMLYTDKDTRGWRLWIRVRQIRKEGMPTCQSGGVLSEYQELC